MIIFTQPAPVLEQALLGWFKTHKAPQPTIRQSTRSSRKEMWVDVEDTAANELYQALSTMTPTQGGRDLTRFYWAVFPQGTLWGDVYEEEKARKQDLRKLSARPGEILRRVKSRASSGTVAS